MKKGKTKGDMTCYQIVTKDSYPGNVFELYEWVKSFERYTGNEYVTYEEGTRVNKFRIDVQKMSSDMIELLRLFKRIPTDWEGYGNVEEDNESDFYE